jgi:hypothetical protein
LRKNVFDSEEINNNIGAGVHAGGLWRVQQGDEEQ